jgi:hypothetical protein
MLAPFMLTAIAVATVLVVLYVVLAFALPTSWTMDAAGLTLRSAAALGIRIRIPWTEVASIGCGTELVYRTTLESMNLDARITRRRHVTLVRRAGTRAVQFTPRDIADFERQLHSVLAGQPDWSIDESGWHHRGLPTGANR